MDSKTIKEIRLSLNLTQEKFAHRVGVTLSTVNRWENNKTAPSKLAKRQIQYVTAQKEEF